ncbi:hypothetical protein Q4S45_00250 [Massilia sp. R2A-15]|uniref:hypothetical protein n=1 Tax=Massilia sp. R2A-15 TaxID=3064278 RepID=UPI0027355BFA|nr:hypothetical protein [Massilia sp. R2A-15]WLI89600.1 hypothetical protein Q4S45_00250 [Massilia sp. R2A-15]
MINPNSYSGCSEFYEVAKSVVFFQQYGGETRRFRIDALLDPKSGRFSTSAYIEEAVNLQRSYPVANGKFTTAPDDFRIWVVFTNLGWTDRASAEAAIEQAMAFLGSA